MGKKIPKQILLARRMKAWELRLRGYTYERIAKELGISSAAVCKIMQRLTKKYAERHTADIDRVKADQVAAHEEVAFEAFQAWERSKEAAKIFREKKAVDSNGQSFGVSERTMESRNQDGDPQYLQVYMKAKENIRKIIGADAPIKSDVRYSELDSLSDDELRKEAAAALNATTAENFEGNNSSEEESIV